MSMNLGRGSSARPPKKTNTQIIQEHIDKINKKLTGFNGPDARVKKYAVGTPEYKTAAAEAKKLRDDISDLNVKLAASKRTTVQEALQKARDSGNSDEVTRREEELAAINAIEKLMQVTPNKFVIFSYSSGGRATKEQLIQIFKENSIKTKIIEISHNHNVMKNMTSTNQFLRDQTDHKEFLILLER